MNSMPSDTLVSTTVIIGIVIASAAVVIHVLAGFIREAWEIKKHPKDLAKDLASTMSNLPPAELIAIYRASSSQLKLYKERWYASGSKVLVKCKRYEGPGVVQDDGLHPYPLNQVRVKMPNGDSRWYNIDDVTPQLKVVGY